MIGTECNTSIFIVLLEFRKRCVNRGNKDWRYNSTLGQDYVEDIVATRTYLLQDILTSSENT